MPSDISSSTGSSSRGGRESTGKPLRVVYAAGPGDVAATYRHWRNGADDPLQVAMTYSGMFYDLCARHGDSALVISSNTRAERIMDGSFTIVQQPTPLLKAPGPLFHLGQIWAALRVVALSVSFRADVVVAVEGSGHWFVLGLLSWFGISVIPSVHCVMWPKFRPPGKPHLLWQLVHAANGRFFSRCPSSILTASDDIADQLRDLTDDRVRKPINFLPTYRPDQFEAIAPPDPCVRPMRVLFVGRIEENKGVFDLLSVARRFAQDRVDDIEFDLCGTGSALQRLRREADTAGLAARFRCHGHCDRQTMRQMYSRSHVVVVPTKSDFVEGFNQVVAEAALAHRPVITSAVCPAIQYVGDAAIEVPPDDVTAYGDMILALYRDPALYARKLQACTEVRSQFLDLDNAWNTKLASILLPIRAGCKKH